MSQQNDIAAVQAVLALANAINPQPAQSAGSLADLFDGVGPSQEFMDTRLKDAGVTAEELQQIKAAIDGAIQNNDIQTINKIAKTAVAVLGGIKDILF